jgi:uridine kinase
MRIFAYRGKVYLIQMYSKVFKDVCIKKRDVGDVIEKYLTILKPLYERFVLPVIQI